MRFSKLPARTNNQSINLLEFSLLVELINDSLWTEPVKEMLYSFALKYNTIYQ